MQASQVLSHRSGQIISVWIAVWYCHAETGKALPQTDASKLEAQNRLECNCMLLRFPFTGTKEPES